MDWSAGSAPDRERGTGESVCLTDKEISAELRIAYATVKKHIGTLNRKLATRNRVQLAVAETRARMVRAVEEAFR